jgi:Uma2 family endonuclease
VIAQVSARHGHCSSAAGVDRHGMLPSMLDPQQLLPERVRPLRAREYMRLVEAGVFAEEHIELLGGVLVAMSPQGEWHAEIVRFLAERLTLALHGRYWVRSHSGLRVADDSVPEPDIAVVPVGRRGQPVKWARLVIEVADSSLQKDRLVKTGYYAACSIPEYWIVDLQHGLVEVLTGPEPKKRRYRRHRVLRRGETLRPLRLPSVAIGVKDVLPTPPRRRIRQRKVRH